MSKHIKESEKKQVNFVDIIVPVFNEEENLNLLLERTTKSLENVPYKYRIILVDDGSSDRSTDIIREWITKKPENIVLICLNRNYGQHAAIIAGFENCDADVIITIDADLQNPPEAIPTLVQKVQEGYDIVYTTRGGGRKDNIFRRASSILKDYMVRKITRSNMRDSGCMLIAYRKEIIDVVLRCNERFIYIPVLANSFTKKTTEIVVEHAKRAYGESKYNFWKLLQLFFDILTGSTFMPLRFLTIFGGMMCIAGLSAGILLIILRLLFGSAWAMNGVFTLFGVLFFFVGVQFFVFGIFGEYICRISMDVRNRPKFVIASKEGNINKTIDARL